MKNEDGKEKGIGNDSFGKSNILAFLLAFVLALLLWFVVNLNKDYTIMIDLPLQVVNIPENIALSENIPERVSANLIGEGWSLINLYNNPPAISLNADNRQINLYEEVRQQLSSFAEITVNQVEPILVSIETEELLNKKVPVQTFVELSLREQYGAIGGPTIQPDSITISGPASKVSAIREWQTKDTVIEDISTNVDLTLELTEPEPGITISPDNISYQLNVSEFTESELRIPIRTRNLPAGMAITYTPSSVTVKFDVPIEQFSDIQDVRPYTAYVDYETLREDDTGLITPEIELVSDEFNLRLRSFQPSRVSYFSVVPN